MSLFDALAPSKKIACGAVLRQLYEAANFIAGVPIICQILPESLLLQCRGSMLVKYEGIACGKCTPGLLAHCTTIHSITLYDDAFCVPLQVDEIVVIHTS